MIKFFISYSINLVLLNCVVVSFCSNFWCYFSQYISTFHSVYICKYVWLLDNFEVKYKDIFLCFFHLKLFYLIIWCQTLNKKNRCNTLCWTVWVSTWNSIVKTHNNLRFQHKRQNKIFRSGRFRRTLHCTAGPSQLRSTSRP